MKLKNLLNENVLGDLPSSKLMKMKWNPVTDKKQVKEEKLNELNSKMMRVAEKRDKLNFADACEGYVHTFAKNGFSESDVHKYLSDLVATYVRTNYRKASR